MFKLLQAKTILIYGGTTSFLNLFSNRTTGYFEDNVSLFLQKSG